VVLGGGRGSVWGALAGAFALETLFTLLNFTSVPSTMRDAIQGAIIIAAVAYSGIAFGGRRRRSGGAHEPPRVTTGPEPTGSTPSPDPAGTVAARGAHTKENRS
jgi:ribose transport system permease protein